MIRGRMAQSFLSGTKSTMNNLAAGIRLQVRKSNVDRSLRVLANPLIRANGSGARAGV